MLIWDVIETGEAVCETKRNPNYSLRKYNRDGRSETIFSSILALQVALVTEIPIGPQEVRAESSLYSFDD